MNIIGIWNVKITTPLGIQAVTFEFKETNGVLEGVAKGEAETTILNNLVVDGTRVTWEQSISKPMRLHLKFDITIDRDTLNGTSKAGFLPASKVIGTRAFSQEF